jgi:hypothetical protein
MTAAQQHILSSLAHGATLKAHRTLDGEKVYKLHPLNGAPPEVLADALVDSLRQQKLIQSNLKFPAAVYLLTDKGLAAARTLVDDTKLPVTTQNYPI